MRPTIKNHEYYLAEYDNVDSACMYLYSKYDHVYDIAKKRHVLRIIFVMVDNRVNDAGLCTTRSVLHALDTLRASEEYEDRGLAREFRNLYTTLSIRYHSLMRQAGDA